MQNITLNNKSAKKITSKNPWLYENEVVLPQYLEDGELVKLKDANGHFLGIGYGNHKSKIKVRILSYFDVEINKVFFMKKIIEAKNKREQLAKTTNAYRIAHSEADFLAGLIIDCYDSHYSIQINTAGMERFRDLILEILISFNPKSIFEKSDKNSREKEGLSTEHRVLHGKLVDSIAIYDNDVKFTLNPLNDQKTGFYLDQRNNRKKVAIVAKNKKVLDLFCNSGGFGIYALKHGAKSVDMVDSSKNAMFLSEENLRLNDLQNYNLHCIDVFDFIAQNTDKYDVIVIDPPSFAKNKAQVFSALKAWKMLVVNAIKSLNIDENNGGILALYSCSHHIGFNELLEVAKNASLELGKNINLLEYHTQSEDHPFDINQEKSLYLSGVVLRVF